MKLVTYKSLNTSGEAPAQVGVIENDHVINLASCGITGSMIEIVAGGVDVEAIQAVLGKGSSTPVTQVELLAPIPNPIMTELANSAEVRVLEYAPDQLEKVLDDVEFYRRATMEAGCFRVVDPRMGGDDIEYPDLRTVMIDAPKTWTRATKATVLLTCFLITTVVTCWIASSPIG